MKEEGRQLLYVVYIDGGYVGGVFSSIENCKKAMASELESVYWDENLFAKPTFEKILKGLELKMEGEPSHTQVETTFKATFEEFSIIGVIYTHYLNCYVENHFPAGFGG